MRIIRIKASFGIKDLTPILSLAIFLTLLQSALTACPAGSSCQTDGTVIGVCPAGQFSIADQYTCQNCPIGTKCPGTENTAPTSCGSGEYQTNTGQISCNTCPPGHMCPVTTISPVACPSGWYAAAGQTTCTVCNDGQYCPLYSDSRVSCPTGTYSKTSSEQCQVCPAGYSCDSNAAANPTVCPVTQFKVKSGKGTCQACPAGMECLDRTSVPSYCSFGEYSTSADGICSTCIANSKQCPDIKTANTRTCPSGTFYDWWSTPPHCKPCEPGFICHSTSFNQIPCPAGHYDNNGVCTICPSGSFCPQTYVNPIACPSGYYQPTQGATSCLQIPPGYLSSDRIALTACDSGTYFSGLGSCTDCPAGFMCPDPKIRKIPCMPGEYQNQVKQTSCITCPAGSYCSNTVSAPVAVTGDNFAPAGSINQIPCPVGYECSASAVLNPICQWGQYHDGSSCQKQVTSNFSCPAGKFCTQIRGDAPRTCQEGTYSPAGIMDCIPCPPGKECSVDGATITTCPAGKYSFETEYSCTWGRPNYYTPLTTSSISAPCPPGSYQDSQRNTCLACPANQKCELFNSAKLLTDYTPAAGSTAVACSGSTFSLAGDGFCRDNLPGMDGTNICALGTYSSGTNCIACEVGHYCPDPSLMPIECPPGTYQDTTSQTTCKVCSAGKYCLYKESAQIDCPVGYYCMVSWQAPQPCPAGHYSDGNAQSCTPCPDKKYCDGAAHGPLASLADCPANMYCNTPFLGALPQYRLCPAGTKSTVGSAAFASDCTTCSAGTYCEFTLTRTEVTCPKGYICPAGTQYRTQYPCPEGTYNALTGKSLDTDCLDCPAGSYCRAASTISTNPCPYGANCPLKADNEANQIWCPEGFYSNQSDGQSAGCTVCPAGHFCPKAATKAFPCPPGTFRAGTGGIDLHSCSPCSAGYACRLPGQTSDTSQDCANGHYCPLGTESPYQFPCPYGTWSNSVTLLPGITGCVACPAGYACPLGSHTLADIFPCPQGHYCPAGTKFPYSQKCPAGTYNLLRQKSQESDCVDCPAGYFCPAGSPSPTDLCPPGHYCPLKTKYKYQYPCRSGTYNPKWGQTAVSSCVACPERYYCPEGTDWPIHCPRGHFCTASREFQEASQTAVGDPVFTTRNAAPIVTAGSYAARRSSAQTVCANGKYSHTGANRCETCPNGFACELNAAGLENVIQNKKCPAGDWCFDGTGTTHAQCPLGSYCLLGDFLPHQCKAGTYSDSLGKSSRETCSNTAAGYWTPPGSAFSSRYQCEPGHYCPLNSIQSDQTPCQAGTYRNTIGATAQSDCTTCPVGHYCPIGTSEPIPCGDGHYCDETGLSIPKDCAPGTFSDIDKRDTACEACPVGKACTHYGLSKPDFLCASGFLCTAGQSETSGDSIVCTAGGYCQIGTTIKESCKAGTYNPNTGKEYLLDCQNCPAGQYCSGGNLSITSGDCSAGYYCTGGSTTPTQNVALPGYYTQAGASSQTKCNAGEYQDLFAQSSCKPCQAGFYCNTEANDGTQRLVCPAGSYCIANSQSPAKCPTGTYSYERGLKAESECLSCLPGYYCPLTGTYEQAQMTLCNAGYFCKQGAVVGTPASDTPLNRYGPCPVGHYCPVGTAEPIPCPAGTFSNTQNLGTESDCTPCTAGKYCPTQGLTAATLSCDAGYFCPSGEKQARRAANACPAGYYCPSGSAISIECPSGQYQPNTRQSSCITCPNGYSCVTSKVTPTPCPAGNYCEGGNDNTCAVGTYNPSTFVTTSAKCAACPPGKYCINEGLASYSAPLSCPAGFYCDLSSQKQAGDYTGQCQAGKYCPEGSPFPIDCPGGKYCDGSDTLYDCLAGYYCKASATKGNPASASEGGGICPAGYYCPLGSDSPLACPPGTYNPSTGSTSESACLNCPAGKYCQNAAATTFTGSCNSGYFCPAAKRTVPHPVANICPANFYCDGGEAQIACQNNSEYQPNTGQSTCLTCPSGFLCSNSGFTDCNQDHQSYCDSNYQVQSCNSGHYSPNRNAASSNECVAISAGFSFTVTGTAPSLTFTQSKCTAGKYCTQGSSTFLSCPAGFYCPEGSAAPIKCKAGQYCSGVDNIAPDGNCAAGYYCIEGASSATPTDGTTGNICPKGYYCPAGSNSPVACPIGTYRNSLQGTSEGDCSPCDAGRYCDGVGLESPNILCFEGYYCDASSTSPNPREHSCTPGHKCPVGSTAQTSCAEGEYQPAPLQGSCLPCPERYYCNTTGMRKALLCPVGKFCPQGTSTPTDCAAGTYNPRQGLKSQNQCKSCPLGYGCATTGMSSISSSQLCTAGSYCPLGSTSKTQNQCPAGYYCPAGTHSPLPCPVGTYSDALGLVALTGCQDCPAGQYCPLTAASSAQVNSDTYKCTAGYFCSGKAITATPQSASEGGNYCSAGKYCPRGATAELDCLQGTYNPYVGRGECIACPAGRLCATTGLTSFTDCPAGGYCPQGSSAATPCPAGTYSPLTNLASASECLECDPGKYCSGGANSVTGDCDAGYACFRGSSTKTPTGTFSLTQLTNGLCPAGHYCPLGTKLPIQCPEGTYSSSTGLQSDSDCTACSPGFYCDEKGLIAPVKTCSAGFFCISGSTHPKPTDGTKGRPCSPGNYCLAGTTVEIPCSGGTYEPRDGSSQCQQCPLGHYCPAGATAPLKCPVNKYCPAGSQVGVNCPSGTYNSDQLGLEKLTQCTPCITGSYCQQGKVAGVCDAGYFCHTGAAVSNPSDQRCPKGHYCLSNTTAPTVCPVGTVNENEGATSESDCVGCQLGYYCLESDPVPHICPKGYYCDGQNSGNDKDPKPCPVDTYNPSLKQDNIADCLACPAGTYCNETAIAFLDLYECDKGQYCENHATPGTLIEPKICPGGTYNDKRGAGDLTECLQCPAGSYCNSTTGTIYPTKCNPGYYCPAGTQTEQNCTAENYCPYGSPAQIPCPAGYYCPNNNMYKIDGAYKCPPGSYCPLGSTSITLCPVGSYGASNPDNHALADECFECEQGYYQDQEGQTSCKVCEPGYICLGNTTAQFPTAVQNGKQCAAGYYCPQGSWAQVPCPVGTYQPEIGKSAASDCNITSINYFTNKEAQTSQTWCGENAFNLVTGSSTCFCKGKNRDFQPETSSCMCSIGFEPVGTDSLQNSKEDCQPVVYNLCSGNKIYNDRRECVDPNDCSSQCSTQVGGLVIENVGLCQCNIVSDPELVCGASCRASKDQFYVNSQGQIEMTSGGTTTTIDPSTRPQLSGSLVCSGTCKMYSVGFSSSFFSGNYDMQSYIKTGSSSLLLLEEDRGLQGYRQLASSQTEVLNPIICLKETETLVFQVNSGTKEYPVYDTSSLLNTNNSFNYTAFTNLQTQIESGSAAISSFAFTFQTQGTYIFMNSLDNTKKMVVAVKTDSNACPNSDIYLMPITTQNLLSIGVEPKSNLFYQPNWILIMGVLFAILVLIIILVLFILYYKRKQWKIEMPLSIPYRRLHNNTEFEEISANTKTLFKRPAEEDDETEGLSSSHQSERDREEEQKQRKQNERYAIEQKKLDEMLNQADRIQTDFFNSDDRDEDMHRIVQLRVRDLLDRLRRIREGDDDSKEGSERPGTAGGRESLFGKDNESIIDARKHDADKAQKEEERQVEKNSKEKQEFIEKMLADNDERQERFKRMLQDKNLSEEEKQALMKDFEMGERRINGILEEEDRKQQDSLQRKLQERRERRNKMRSKVEDLERMKEQKNKELREAIEDLNDETAAKMQQVNDELQGEEDDVLGQVKERMERQRMNKRQEFQQLLGKNKKSEDMEQMINEYEEESHALERKLQSEFDSQKKNLRQTLEERRERKRLQLENERREKEKQLIQMKNEEMADLEQELEKLKRVVENEKLNEKIENMVNQRLNKEDEQLEHVKEENKKQQDELERKHQEELERLEMESVTTGDDSVAHRDLIDLDDSRDEEGKEFKRKEEELRKQIEGSDDPALRAQLMRQLEEHQDAMKMKIQKEQQSQKASLEDKLAQRKMRKLQKKRELQEKQDQEKRYLQEKHLEDEQKIKMDNGDNELQQILREIKLNVEVDARPFAIQKAMDEKHAKELSDLLMKQFKEKAIELQGHMQSLMDTKTEELRINKDLHEKKLERLNELKGAVDDQQFTRRVEEVKASEADKREDIEDKYLQLQARGQNEITKRLLEKHTDELLKLKEKQNKEKQKIIENYIPEGLAREVFSDNIEDIQEDMENFKRDIEERKQREMDAIAERERILKEQSEMYRLQRNKLEAHEKFLTQNTAFAGARKKVKRFDMEQDAVTEQQKKLFDQYRQQDDEMKKIVMEEQIRQKEGFEDKLKQRREKREKMRQEREKELEELKQQQLLEEEKERELEKLRENSHLERLIKQHKDLERVYDKVKGGSMVPVEEKKEVEKKKEVKKVTRPTTQAMTHNFLGINIDQQYSSESPLGSPRKPGGASDDIIYTIMRKIHTIEERLLQLKQKK